METLQEIHINCSECQRFIAVEIEALQEEKYFNCPRCFTTTIVDTDKLLKGMEKFMEKVKKRVNQI
jgi:uncharacterized paraquat-inducible protein A